MFIKRVILSLACSAIALTLLAQSSLKSYSTYSCSDQESVESLMKYCPGLQIWDNHDRNFPCFVSVIKLNSNYSTKESEFHYSPEKIKSLKELNLTKDNVLEANPFLVTLVKVFEGKLVKIQVPTVYWNITHKKKDRYKDLTITDFQLKRLLTYSVVDGRLFFFVQGSNNTVLCYYYKSLGSLIYENIGEVYNLDKNSIIYFSEWLKSIPVLDFTNEWKSLIANIVAKSEGKTTYVCELDLSSRTVVRTINF